MIEKAIHALSNHGFVLLFDDLGRDNCGYIACPADSITKASVNILVTLGRGLIFTSLPESLATEKGLSLLQADRYSGSLPMTIGIESRQGVHSGISAEDRATTIRSIVSTSHSSKTISAPGHIFPLISNNGGLLVKTGVAEALSDLLTISGKVPIGSLSHLLDEKGSILSLPGLQILSQDKNIPLVALSSIIRYRLQTETLVTQVSKTKLPTDHFGQFDAYCYISKHDSAEHLVLSQGTWKPDEAILTRMHSEQKLTDLFSFSCNTISKNPSSALKKIHQAKKGVFVYIRKARKNAIASALQNSSPSPSHKGTKDIRELGIGAQILRDLNVHKLRLLSSSKKSLIDLSAFDLEVVEQVPL